MKILQFYKILLLVSLSFFITSCTQIMRGNVVTFYEGPLPTGETIRVEALDPSKSQSIEFKQYAILLYSELERIGYTPVDSSTATVDLIAEFDYSIERESTITRVERPYPYPYAYYHFYYKNYYNPYYFGLNTRFEEPVYSALSYVRNLEFNIVKSNETRERIFEGKVESTGNQSQLPEIMPYMITALFNNYPGNSGVTKVVSIEMDE